MDMEHKQLTAIAIDTEPETIQLKTITRTALSPALGRLLHDDLLTFAYRAYCLKHSHSWLLVWCWWWHCLLVSPASPPSASDSAQDLGLVGTEGAGTTSGVLCAHEGKDFKLLATIASPWRFSLIGKAKLLEVEEQRLTTLVRSKWAKCYWQPASKWNPTAVSCQLT